MECEDRGTGSCYGADQTHLGKLSDGDFFFSGYLLAGNRLLTESRAAAFFGDLLNRKNLFQVLAELNGSYVYIVREGERLHFGVDHFGGRNLFYQLEPEFRIYENPYLEAGDLSYSDEAFCCLLSSGYTIGDETLFCRVRECASGVAYAYDLRSGRLSSKVWFKYNPRDCVEADSAEIEKLLLNSLPEKVGSYLLPLSGGLDSRTLLAVALKKRLPLRAFSYGLAEGKDLRTGVQICREMKIDHATYPTTEEARKVYFDARGFRQMVEAINKGRSLPEESDWIAMNQLQERQGVICPGHTGDWLTGGHIDARLYSLRSIDELVAYLLDVHFGLTALSDGEFRSLLKTKIKQSLEEILSDNGGDLVASAERWNLEHRQRKYIINSADKYRHLGLTHYLPFYDRFLMDYFRQLKTEFKLGQRGYVSALRERLFTAELGKLRTIANTRMDLGKERGFREESLVQKVHRLIRMADLQKRRKRLFPGQLKGYDDAVVLLSDRSAGDFLRQRLRAAFPMLPNCADQLRGQRCHQAARHVDWILEQRVCQMNVNGLFMCAFLPFILKVSD